jgi:RNA polymerase sigma factor (sigma-70 family)
MSELRIRRCQRQHSVKVWDPEVCSFSNFLWQAVKGPMAPRNRNLGQFAPKALVQGMHFWNLHLDSHLHLADVLVWVCNIDGTRNFEGLPCLECQDKGRGKVIDESAFRTVIPRLIIPSSSEGRYSPKDYWNCQHCRRLSFPDYPHFPHRHYYPDYLAKCPKCGRGRLPGAKRSQVYLLGPPRQSEPPSDEPPPEHTAEKAQLRAALSHLDPKAQKIIKLRYFAYLQVSEVADKLHLTPKEVKSLEADALDQLKAQLQIKNDHDE